MIQELLSASILDLLTIGLKLCIVSIICMTLISITVITVSAITMKFLGVIQKPTEY